MEHHPNNPTDPRHNPLMDAAVDTKSDDAQVEFIEHEKAEAASVEEEITMSKEEQRKLQWKIDLRIVPILGFLYMWAIVDRTNLGGARIAGIDQATGMDVGNRASIVILVFYIGYILFELPSNMILQKVGPANWLAGLTLCWGIVTLCVGFVRSWQALAGLRVLLGIFEAGMTPGSMYLMASWYSRYQYQRRFAVFIMTGNFCASFANILAYGLTQIADQPEINGWKWIFIVEGCITIAYGVLCWFVIPDTPFDDSKNPWLSAKQKAMVRQKLTADMSTMVKSKVTWAVIKDILCNFHVWTLAAGSMAGSCGAYSFALFLPIILRRSLGFSLQMSFILTAPPQAYAVVWSFGLAYLSDKYRTRGIFMILHCFSAILGLGMIAFAKSVGARYAGAFFGQGGVCGLMITATTWGMNNIRGDAKKSVLSAFIVTWASIGGIYSALVFRQQDAPSYVPGVAASGALVILSLVMTILTIIQLKMKNRQADQGKLIIEGLAEFRYTL